MRLNKYLAHATGMSRREADLAISAGRVSVNSTKAILGVQINENDTVTFDNKTITRSNKLTYLLLNKPVGYLCSRRSQGGTPTVYSLLPKQYHHLKLVGRLDKDSSGLILLTDDGDFTYRMTHPSFRKIKKYEVKLNEPLEPLHQQMISDYGVQLPDGKSQFLIEKLNAQSRYTITMHEGRNRQIRRTFTALGYTVTQLHRVSFGNYTLGDIKNGEHTLADMR